MLVAERHLERVLLLAVGLAAVGCKDGPSDEIRESGSGDAASEQPEEKERWDGEVKLAEILARAEIESPFGQVVELDQIHGERVLELDFERQTERALGWKRSAQGRIVRKPKGKGRALAIKPSANKPLAILIGAEPSEFYRVSRSVFGNSHVVELFVLETNVVVRKDRLNHPADLNRALAKDTQAGSFVRLRALVGQRRFEPTQETKGWQRDDLVFSTKEETRSLLLVFQTMGESKRSARPVFFDDVEVVRLEPDANERLALVRDRYRMETQGPQSLHAFGQFLPLPPAADVHGEDELLYEYRHGIIAAAPTSIGWRLRLPKDVRFSFGLAALRESPPGSSTHCTVKVDDEVLFDALVEADAATEGWKQHEIDLSSFAGRDISLEVASTSDEQNPALAVFSNPVLWRPRKDEDRPPVFLIAVDTLRADRMGLYGHPRENSPHIEELARDGIVFDDAIAQSNWTPESFASLFTSTYSGQHQVTRRLAQLHENRMAHVLREAGYDTKAIAYKLLLYDMGFERGFDAFFNVPKFHLTKSYTIRAEDNLARALQWLERDGERQTFLFWHLNDPHQPFNHDGDSLTRFADTSVLDEHQLRLPILIANKVVRYGAKDEKCSSCVEDGRYARWFVDLTRDLYDGEVHFTDKHVGRLLDELRTRGIYDDALIVFLSDHGEGLADHHDYIGHGFHHLQEEQVRVPLVIKPPRSAGFTAGSRVTEQVQLVDVYPTILELAGLEKDESAEGISLVPLMRGEAVPERLSFSENGATESLMVRDGRYKYVLRYGKAPPREHLYDLETDPHERREITSSSSARKALEAMRTAAAEHLARTRPGRYLLFAAGDDWQAGGLILRPKKGKAKLRALLGSVTPRGGGRTWRIENGDKQSASTVLVEVLEGASDCTWEAREIGRGGRQIELPPLANWEKLGASVPQTLHGSARVIVVNNPVRGVSESRTVSGQQLEALQALGYVE